ncbi:Aste57867_17938 [Aphanomyces stellatus]|uniref:Aste57867_17938 protein n=1 Tax=Aphanomyces stellatus TaxID=120398 RepID=A0A485L9G4_9STRA|nr:hypothetical protein As57867_017876 [Aphanomyces stellatus]VFT94679.1 Aste57867_17938 [Aphanomyces stellatus]
MRDDDAAAAADAADHRAWHHDEAIQRHVLSFLGPRDTARLSSLNRSFHHSARHSLCLDLTDGEDILAIGGVASLVSFYTRAHVLRLHRSFGLPSDLDPLMRLECLREASFQDVVCLTDAHLALLTTHAPSLRLLHVEGSHEVQTPHIASLPLLESLVFKYNLLLQSISFDATPSSLVEIHVTACPSFDAFDALVAAVPHVRTANFSQSNALAVFHCRTWPELHTLLLDRSPQLAVLDIDAPKLKSLNVQLCGRLTQAVLVAASLQSVSFSMLPALQVLYLDCPSLTRLNLTGNRQLEPTGTTLECPKLKKCLFQGTRLHPPPRPPAVDQR